MNKQVNYKSLLLLAVIILFGSSNNFAQTKLSILYKHGTIKGSLQDYLKPNSTARWNGKFSIDEFTINDTITYYETFETLEEKDEFTVKGLRKNRRNKVLGKNFVPRSNYCNYAKGINVEEVEWKDDNYLVKDSILNKQKTWVLSDESKVVLGYPCKQAYLMQDAETSLVVWYTENFKCSYSNDGDTSLPGTILETYIPKTSTLITAIDLQIETNAIMIPKGILITQDAFQKLKKNKKG